MTRNARNELHRLEDRPRMPAEPRPCSALNRALAVMRGRARGDQFIIWGSQFIYVNRVTLTVADWISE